MTDDKQQGMEPGDEFVTDDDAFYTDGPMRIARGTLERQDGTGKDEVIALVLSALGNEDERGQAQQQVIQLLSAEDARELARQLEASAAALIYENTAAAINEALHEADLIDEAVTVKADTSFITSAHDSAQVETDE